MYTLTDSQRDRVKAAAQQAQAALEANERSQAAIRTLVAKRPTFDEELDGMRPIVLTVIVNRGQAPLVTISYGDIGRGAQDASATFAPMVADFLSDDADIEAMNAALTEAAR